MGLPGLRIVPADPEDASEHPTERVPRVARETARARCPGRDGDRVRRNGDRSGGESGKCSGTAERARSALSAASADAVVSNGVKQRDRRLGVGKL